MDAPLAGGGCRGADPADRRSAPSHQRGRHLQPLRGAGARHPRTAPAAPDRARPRRDRRRTEHDRRGDQGLSRHPVVARPHPADRQGRTGRRARRIRHAAPHRDRRRRRRHGRRGPDPARGHGRHRHAMPATSSACRCRPTARSAAAARAAPACRPRTRISSPGCSSPTPTRRCCSSPRAASSTRRRSGACRSATPQSRGKALINMLPLEQGERITTIMPLPEDEASWADLDVMFATTRGTVRRNKLRDFVQVNRNGKIAMKLEEEGDEILGVETCTRGRRRAADRRHSASASASRVGDVRVFQAAIRSACAASRWPTATASSR